MTNSNGPPPVEHLPLIAVVCEPPHLQVTGLGFLPRHGVTIRVIEPGGTVGYFRYRTDDDGRLQASLPATLPHGTLVITATDEHPDPADETGYLWTDTATVDW